MLVRVSRLEASLSRSPPSHSRSQSHGYEALSPAVAAAMRELPQLLADLGLPGAQWRATAQGEMACCLAAPLAALRDAAAPASATSAAGTSPREVGAAAARHSLGLWARGGANAGSPWVKLAVVLLCPWHVSVNGVAGGGELGLGLGSGGGGGDAMVLAGAAVHVRLLRRRGFRVAVVALEELGGSWGNGEERARAVLRERVRSAVLESEQEGAGAGRR